MFKRVKMKKRCFHHMGSWVVIKVLYIILTYKCSITLMK